MTIEINILKNIQKVVENRDETGLLKLLQEQGYTTNPMKKSQYESTRYNGGYIINNYDCLRGKMGYRGSSLKLTDRIEKNFHYVTN
jgi:hypothetical protein